MDESSVPENIRPQANGSEAQSKVSRRLSITPSNYLLALATILVLSIAYYFVIALPAHDHAKLALEREKFQVQQREAAEKKATAEAEKKAAEAKELSNSFLLDECTKEADNLYWEYVKLNGGKEDLKRPGIYTASRYVWEQAEKNKKAALDECYKKYKSN